MQRDVLRGRSPDVVRKEVWAHLLVYNVIRALMATAARGAGVCPEELSFTGALQAVNAFLPHLRAAATEDEARRLGGVMLLAIAAHRAGGRPDRYEPRAVKRRPKNSPKLKEPRAQARRKLGTNATCAGPLSRVTWTSRARFTRL